MKCVHEKKEEERRMEEKKKAKMDEEEKDGERNGREGRQEKKWKNVLS